MKHKPEKYRKISHINKVMQWGRTEECFKALRKWTNNAVYYDYQNSPFVFIKTLEGKYPLKKGAFVIERIKGEFYPHDEEIFHDAYEKVE